MTRVRAHKVAPNKGSRFGRREHTRAPRPGTTARSPKPLFRRKPAAAAPETQPAAAGGTPKARSRIQLGALAGAGLLAFLVLAVGLGGSPLLVAAAGLLFYGLRKQGGDQ